MSDFLPLNGRSFSIWDVERHAWAKVKGEFELHVRRRLVVERHSPLREAQCGLTW